MTSNESNSNTSSGKGISSEQIHSEGMLTHMVEDNPQSAFDEESPKTVVEPKSESTSNVEETASSSQSETNNNMSTFMATGNMTSTVEATIPTINPFFYQPFAITPELQEQMLAPYKKMYEMYENSKNQQLKNNRTSYGSSGETEKPTKKRKTSKKGASTSSGSNGNNSSHNNSRDSGSAADNKNCRDDSSLRLLTKKFVNLIAEAQDGVVDLNNAAETLGVQKRRIYDITNVLEGIGLIEKKSKNNIQWKGSGIAVSQSENSEEITQLNNEMSELESQDTQLDIQINTLRSQLRELTDSEEYQNKAYVTYNDIRNIEQLKNRTIIAIRAPPGATLQVPDPDDGLQFPQRRYQIFLQSPSTPIKVYLLSNDEQQSTMGQEETETQKQQSDDTVTPALTPSALTQDSMIQASTQEDPHTPPTKSQTSKNAQGSMGLAHTPTIKSAKHVPVVSAPGTSGAVHQDETTMDSNIQKLSPPPADPDFIYGMEPNEGISDLYENYGDISQALGDGETSRGLFD